MKVIMTRGLPGSGKSWWAKEYQNDHPEFDRVNKDDLRLMLHDGKWSKHNERIILEARDTIVRNSLTYGRGIIVDDTNFEQKHIDAIKSIADSYGAEFEVKDFYTPVEQCIDRDSKRVKSVGRDVIMQMYRKYLCVPPTPPEHVQGIPYAIICDIDGTIAKKGDRDIYDGSRAYLDTIIKPVSMVVDQYHGTVIYVTGRNAEHSELTKEWLKNNVRFDGILFTRKDGDKRPDYIVKKEIYDSEIKGKYNVSFVIDDRKQVKRMWVQEGLFVLDVNQTDDEF